MSLGETEMKNFIGWMFMIVVFIASACSLPGQIAPTQSVPTIPATATQPAATATEIHPIATLAPTSTSTQAPGATVLDFVAQLCNAQWMNGGQHLKACPNPTSDHTGGYAVVIDPVSESLAANTPVILTTPAQNGFAALFLRYPSFMVKTGDHFRATLRCQSYAACDVEYALEYYDANGNYHSPFLSWKYKAGDPAITVDADLSSLAGQTIEFVLTLRPNNDPPQQDNSLWIAPQIYRSTP
jgi:hypothetical protein